MQKIDIILYVLAYIDNSVWEENEIILEDVIFSTLKEPSFRAISNYLHTYRNSIDSIICDQLEMSYDREDLTGHRIIGFKIEE